MAEKSKAPTQRRNGKSKREQIRVYAMDLIKNGIYGPGDTLPTLRTMAQEFHTSITPVLQALRDLEAEGLIEMIQGHGCRVRNISTTAEGVTFRPVIDVVGVIERAQPAQRRHTIWGLQMGLIQALSATSEIKLVVSTMPSIHNPEGFNKILQEINQAKPEGVALGQVGILDSGQLARLRQLRNAGIEIACFAAHHEFPEFDRVVSDFVNGQRKLTEYFLEKGHTEFLRVSFGFAAWYEQQKQEGFRLALEAAGHDPETADACTVIFDHPSGTPEEMQARLERLIGILTLVFLKRPVTVILAANDLQAAEIRQALEVLGRKDVEVAGYDACWNEIKVDLGHRYGEHVLAAGAPVSVDQRLVECGEGMADLLMRRVLKKDLPDEPQVILVPQEVVVPTK
jgi:DNA-binding LacI/PurR family transcriptional regulator/DNA-binding transcriptional regulator YhcF (GntR family)